MGGDERQLPFFFQKPTDAVVADGAAVPYPSMTSDFQHEVELVLAIGRAGANIAVADAASHVFGVAAGIDLTRRDIQVAARKFGRPWESGKSFDHSAPIGSIHRLDGAALPRSGAISLRVDGEIRQRGDIAEMIWNCAEIVSEISRQYMLKEGDLIYTGTPAGVGPVLPGSRLVAQVDGVGTLAISILA